jgi:ribosome-associated protein YbcJ (S4-like RNA binding protein)
MAKRPIKQKRLARLRKQVYRTPLTRYIDLVQWLKDRRYAQTTGEAERLMTDGKVKTDAHIIGRERVSMAPEQTAWEKLTDAPQKDPEIVWFPRRYIRAEFRDTLRVEV